MCVCVCVRACVRAVRCELKFYILFTPISSLAGFTYLNPGLLARNEYQWGRFSDWPTRDRDFPRFSSVIELMLSWYTKYASHCVLLTQLLQRQ